MDLATFQSLLGDEFTIEDTVNDPDDGGGLHTEEDRFVADVVNSLASAHEDPDIVEYISLLAEGPARKRLQTRNNDPEPSTNIRTAPFTKQDWAEHREELEVLYSENDLKLKDIMKIMKDKYNLSAGETQFRRQFARWGLEKNVKFNEMRKIIQIWMRRQQEGKNTQFLVRNRPVPFAKILRFRKRTGALITESSPAWRTPSHIVYFTPEIILKTSMANSSGADISGIVASADATDHALDLFATYLSANPGFSTFDQNSNNLPHASADGGRSLAPDFHTRGSTGSLSFHPLHSSIGSRRMRDDPDADAFSPAQQQQYWQTSTGASTSESYARIALSQPITPSYQLIPRWEQDPDLQQLIRLIEAHLLQPQQQNPIPNEQDVTALLQKAIINDDRSTMVLVLHYQRKDDFPSRCPIHLLQLAQSHLRHELFAILIMHGLMKDGDDRKEIDPTRLKQAQAHLQYGYPFLSNAPQQRYFFYFLHTVRIATDAAITSWTLDALLNGDARVFALLGQCRQRCSLHFLLARAPLLYGTMQTNPDTYTLVQELLSSDKREVFKEQWHRLFLATALLQGQMVEQLASYGKGAASRNGLGQTALHLLSTIDYGDGTEAMSALIRQGTKVNAVDCSGNTCLHTAFQSRWNPWKHQFVASLVEAGAGINAQNLSGQTCLTIVAENWRLDQVDEMVAWLSSLGADWSIANKQGQRPDQILQLRKCI